MLYRKNPYFDSFRCLAGQCPDSCCKEWEVQVDPEATAAYAALPGPLGDRLRQVLRKEEGEVYLTVQEGRCPIWRQDGLCQIQAQLGHDALCKTCREFPRLTHDYGDFVELGLELSCPEAARLLLTEELLPPATQEVPGTAQPEYDTDAMGVLLATREEAFRLLSQPRPLGEALALLLLYGYHAQGLLDGDDALTFDPEAALEEARSFAKPGNIGDILDFFLHLELLTQRWEDRLQAPQPGPWKEAHRRLALYGVDRYWLQAVSDYDLVGRVKLVVLSCLLVKLLGGNPVETAQLYSKEIENNWENVEAILDAAYAHPAFTDDKLLWHLLEEPLCENC